MQRLVDSLVLQAGLQHKEEFTFDDFCQILAPQMDKLWNASFDWKGTDIAHPKTMSGLALHLIFHRFSPFNCCLSVLL